MDGPRPSCRILVIDDDPTGSQTVRGCPLLLRWDPPTLRRGLAAPSPLLFVLANTRAMVPDAAAATVREICRAFREALAGQPGESADRWIVVSRGDSTLRGHVPLETDVIAEELGPFAATLHVPAFPEGGRTTVNGVHLLHGRPVADSPFARDRQFGYRNSDLRLWLEEKSGGRIAAAAVGHLRLAQADPAELRRRLAALSGNRHVVVDAERPEQLQALGRAVRELARDDPPVRLLFRSAASLLNGLADQPSRLPDAADAAALAALRRRDPAGRLRPGLVMVGSHVPLADAQLACLLAEPACEGIELPVRRLARVLEGPLPDRLLPDLERQWLGRLRAVLAAGRTPVLHSSRGELCFGSLAARLAFGQALARSMARLAAALAPELGYLISKGGITTHTLLAEGLDLPLVWLEGQLLPGLSLVRPGRDGLPILTFPGNLGEAGTLRRAWRLMEGADP